MLLLYELWTCSFHCLDNPVPRHSHGWFTNFQQIVISLETQTKWSLSTEKIWYGIGESGEGQEQPKATVRLTPDSKGRKQLPPLYVGEENGRVWGYQNPAAQKSGHGDAAQTPEAGVLIIWCWDLRSSEEEPRRFCPVSQRKNHCPFALMPQRSKWGDWRTET